MIQLRKEKKDTPIMTPLSLYKKSSIVHAGHREEFGVAEALIAHHTTRQEEDGFVHNLAQHFIGRVTPLGWNRLTLEQKLEERQLIGRGVAYFTRNMTETERQPILKDLDALLLELALPPSDRDLELAVDDAYLHYLQGDFKSVLTCLHDEISLDRATDELKNTVWFLRVLAYVELEKTSRLPSERDYYCMQAGRAFDLQLMDPSQRESFSAVMCRLTVAFPDNARTVELIRVGSLLATHAINFHASGEWGSVLDRSLNQVLHELRYRRYEATRSREYKELERNIYTLLLQIISHQVYQNDSSSMRHTIYVSLLKCLADCVEKGEQDFYSASRLAHASALVHARSERIYQYAYISAKTDAERAWAKHGEACRAHRQILLDYHASSFEIAKESALALYDAALLLDPNNATIQANRRKCVAMRTLNGFDFRSYGAKQGVYGEVPVFEAAMAER